MSTEAWGQARQVHTRAGDGDSLPSGSGCSVNRDTFSAEQLSEQVLQHRQSHRFWVCVLRPLMSSSEVISVQKNRSEVMVSEHRFTYPIKYTTEGLAC